MEECEREATLFKMRYHVDAKLEKALVYLGNHVAPHSDESMQEFLQRLLLIYHQTRSF